MIQRLTAFKFDKTFSFDRVIIGSVICGSVIWVAVTCGSSASTFAADEKPIAYKAAHILSMAGPELSPGYLVVRGDVVDSVVAVESDLPEDAERIDLGDVTLLPGLVNPISAISESNYKSRGSSRAAMRGISPRDSRKLIGINRVQPKDKVYRRLGRTGFTSVALLYQDSAQLIAGQASVIRPAIGEEKTGKDFAVLEKSYLFLSYASGSSWRSAANKAIKGAADKIIKEREAKKKAEEEAKKKAAQKKADAKKKPEAGKGPSGKPPAPAPKKPLPRAATRTAPKTPAKAAPKAPPKPKAPDALELVFLGKVDAVLRVRTPADFDHLFEFLDTLPLPFQFYLVTGSQPPEIVAKIVEKRDTIRGVILDPSMGQFWETSVFVNTARLFIEKGMPVAFVPARDSLEGFRQVFFNLALMARSGLQESEVLEAVTTVPARMLGLSGKVGSLEKGAFANFQTYSEHPLSGSARLLSVYVEGKKVFEDDPATGELSGEAVR